MRTTRAAAKRAMEDARAAASFMGDNKKSRFALTNLSNNRTDVALRASKLEISKDQAHRKRWDDESGEMVNDVDACTREHAFLAGQDSASQASAGRADVAIGDSAAAMASLEKNTFEKLRISQDIEACGDVERCSPSPGFHDIDANADDPQLCSVYASDIYDNLLESENDHRPSSDYMKALQQDINPNMRGILVDWLVEVAEEYKLVPDTLYLTVSYIDRYLSVNFTTRSRLQLLGVSCMLIAAKYEEIYAPAVDEFCYITDNTYRREEVLHMERGVLNALQYRLTTPTTKSFLRRFLRAAQVGLDEATALQLEFLSNYLAELTLLDYDFLQFLPSAIAASAVFVALFSLKRETCIWTETLVHYTGYKPCHIEECIYAVHALQLNKKGCQLPAVREKYRQHKFKRVASIEAPSTLPSCIFS